MSNFNIKEAREKNGIKQSELAEKMNTSQQVISRYEVGTTTPSLEKLIELAQILDVTLDELVEFKQIQKKYSKKLHNLTKK